MIEDSLITTKNPGRSLARRRDDHNVNEVVKLRRGTRYRCDQAAGHARGAWPAGARARASTSASAIACSAREIDLVEGVVYCC